MNAAATAALMVHAPAAFIAGAAVLSNVVSNVPAGILLLPFVSDPATGALLALASSFAGNLLIVGSNANIIVISAAERIGIHIGWRRHARIGVPVTLITLAFPWILHGSATA